MSKISFLANDDIWNTIPEIIKASKHTDIAVAYLGNDGSKLLPLKKGDRLILDMSLATVKAGTTNPFEVEKLIKRGVKVFTRRNLHAKVILTEKSVLVGSANISKNSRDTLDEAAIYSTDTLVVQRTKDFIEKICIEPVLPEYLNQCKKLYKPPRFTGSNKSKSTKNQVRATHAKLWIVSLVVASIPDKEQDKYENSERKAERRINTEVSVLDNFHWSYKPKMADELESGDWIIQCILQKDKSVLVYPPSRLIMIDHYIRDEKRDKERYIFHLERYKSGQTMKWDNFRNEVKRFLSKDLKKPRTMAIRDIKQADELLRLWTPKGRIARNNK